MPPMRVLADEQQVAGLIDDLTEAVAADMAAAPNAERAAWALIGVRSRGDLIAARMAQRLKPAHVGTLDITLYRDDLSEIGADAVVRTTEIPFSIDGLNVVLIDDVLMTGRSVRAALQSLMDLGRPRRVWLSVLVDRGMRELPIAPDHVALDLSGASRGRTAGDKTTGVGRGGAQLADAVQLDELVAVRLKPTDDTDAIVVIPAEEAKAS